MVNKKNFIGLINGIACASSIYTRSMLLNNQKCMVQNSNEYGEEFHYYPLEVKLDRCVENYNTLNDLSKKF